MRLPSKFKAYLDRNRRGRIPGIHQFSGATAYDRYPATFSEIKKIANPTRALSFGCSTGEECASIRKYWPEVEIVGVDVNEDALKKAAQKFEYAEFYHSRMLPELRPFDLIFAMSVLCRHPATIDKDDISNIYPFALFEETVGALTKAITPGGFLVILNANYRFEDSRWSDGFEAQLGDEFHDEGLRARVRKFSPEGRILPCQKSPCVFKKKIMT